LIPASVINKGFFNKVFEFHSGQGYFLKSEYLGFQRNKENIVGLKFKIARHEILRVFLEAYKSSIHDDIELFRLPKIYWKKFNPSQERIEEDIASEILNRLSDSMIKQGVGVHIVELGWPK
jgi:hypothetical protein